ncbi:MAG: efflux RND transporter periplasmic adaptor subunit [Candidatus Omnitrophica bacterium]|nr:efflux RND transporter periplasmic adaptor subunit [Candidatus Omnitrophota bacterium]MDD5488273.1 efflux RND transporter periplasmic adaptor subunit [Candidatus Omnitrophota bacterium]
MINKEKIRSVWEQIVRSIPENKGILRLLAVLLIAMFLTAQVKGCIARHHKAHVAPRPVRTAKAFVEDTPIYVDSFGTLSSPGNIDIKSQVTGKIMEVFFEQGSPVKKGDLLFVIDAAPYKAALNKAEAAMAEDAVNVQLKVDTRERNKILFEKDLISRQEFEQYQTEAAAAVAKLELDKAGVQSAKIDLEYCWIKSPVDGIAGKRMVDPGNIVSANAGPVLVNVKMMSDLYVDFTLSEKYLDMVRTAMADHTLEAQISAPGIKGKTFTGTLDLIDNEVDDKTGSFALRASVKNEGKELWPGQFVNVRLVLGTRKGSVLVPYAAPQIGKKGYYIFVVQQGNKADLRQVTLGAKQGDNVVVEKGVNGGETVVTVGQMSLSPGMPVVDVAPRTQGSAGKKK